MTKEERERIVKESYAFAKMSGHELVLTERMKQLERDFVDGKLSLIEYQQKALELAKKGL